MKSVRFSFVNKKFDDQYTFELQGYLSIADFNSSFRLLNQTVAKHPPPGSKNIWITAIVVLWMSALVIDYILWSHYRFSSELITLPFFMVLTTLLFIWRHRVMRERFERSIIDVCNRINATENIRGINYRFNKNGSDLNDVTKQMYIHAGTGLKPHYSIVIEFDDRYNALSSHQFNRHSSIDFVTIPLYAHVRHEKNEKNSPFWAAQQHEYDEKPIF
ncbi:hypothetical protein RMCBS344292_13588 [Rhizopus microsporus]|nr:hypothetical protein RMCBS344292_13588 [Rhizopus microsporus]